MNLWFPIGYKITNEYEYKKPKYESQSWQIAEYDNSSLLLVRQELFNKWRKESLLEDYMFDNFSILMKFIISLNLGKTIF